MASSAKYLKEVAVAVLLWFIAGVWTIGVSYWLGYKQPVHSVAGIPNWILWGVLIPWVIFFAAHSWYSLVFLRDDDEFVSESDVEEGTED